MDTEVFIVRAKKIHGDEFSYAQTNFKTWKTPLIIECRVHGAFNQWPETHLKGAGCRRCKAIKVASKVMLQCSQLFVEKSINVHGNKYDYSKTYYVASNKKVIVTCKFHGDFELIASQHLSGVGCKFCLRILNQTYSILKEKQKTISKITIETIDLNKLFIERALKIHENQYDYNKVVYVNNRIEVEILCPIHGSFMQSPGAHLSGAGCKPCADIARGNERSRKSALTFVKRAQKKHGFKYDYSKTIYITYSLKVQIICSKHGSFFITPGSHLNGSGCDPCGIESMRKKRSTGNELFVIRAREKHGNKYDYSMVEYISNHRHVSIICLEHGSFLQSPSGHLSGRGCSKCGIKKQANNARSSLDDFIIKAKSIHGVKYDYSQSIYKSSNTKLLITCPDHGPFLQKPEKHYMGHGCPSCANKDMNTEKFIYRAREAHGNKYDYSKAIYKAAKLKIKIICREHGEFEQVSWNHMEGSGCERCVDQLNSRGVKRIESWLLNNSIPFIREKAFAELKSLGTGNKSLKFDFFIEKFNVLIEFDGEQHFRPNRFWGGEKAFQKQIENDQRKNIFAKEKGYALIRISFKEVGRIENILSAALQVHLFL